jgi:hypothetical protein
MNNDSSVSSDGPELIEAAAAFVDVVDAQYGLYLDATFGFVEIARIVEGPLSPIAGMSKEAQLQRAFFIGTGEPGTMESVMQHKTTMGEFASRNTRDGKNHILMGRLLIVVIYAYWETEHRARIAAALGKQLDDVQVSILGDLRLLRNDILHHRAVATKQYSARLTVLPQVEPGAEITSTRAQAEQLVRLVKAGIDALVLEATGTDPKHRAIWHVP